MTIASFEGKSPHIGAGAYVHPSADVFGDVTIGAECWIGPGARIRGDYGAIVLGDYCSVEDNCVIHARPGERTTIGDWVTFGHGAVIHNVTMIHDYAIVGMGAVVSDWAILGEWAVVGEGAVVRQGQEVPPGHIAVGVPAKVLAKAVGEEYKAQWTEFKKIYVDLARRYPEGWIPLGE
ncbi:MAG: gamma carbonic anhydrase family protein [Anaerolineaceae bacterium 4572_32.2]|nr:MAG: gamma carbonic anhydrase family protein [Anaerolineaceae bacterium 4572_32.2]RLC71722.1 MAG: gamma carbonic anhydrase family protein [Chloroflexota bacterium]HEY72267.1 gamma carbonic anhydrase family protein [Thermoflexia bacterium]